ncbi:hypothetical protein STAS_11965 [Striga asiatica]|uniref:Uncharacterized protein n=1 Tax=Striga asiatica TaxID=4170 RepID=A0A5A7PSL2_STRAF|nr:hypothetical protein STAS_11965 [Striga asiatica]
MIALLQNPKDKEKIREKMYNGQKDERKPGGGPPLASPRISFSNDFIEAGASHHGQIRGGAYRDAPVSDFEFSVGGYSMMSADELFFKGRLLPLKENCAATGRAAAAATTLRDELENGDDGDGRGGGGEGFSLRPPKNPARWRGFLGLRKSHNGSKKADKGGENKTAGCNNNVSHDEDDEFVD